MANKKPQYPVTMKTWQTHLAQITKYLLYLTPILMPIAGYIMSQASGKNLLWFGYSVPVIFSKNENLATATYLFHVYLGRIAIFVIALHILGALSHLVTPKDNTCRRMLSLKS